MPFLKDIVYLDNSSTTKPCESAVNRITDALKENWGNPSSLHRLGIEAELAVSDAREAVARLIGSRSDEVYFTGSGTEGNNTALIGTALKGAKRGNRIVTTSVEHPSVLETLKRLEDEGFEVIRLKPDKSGRVSEESIFEAVNEKTVLVSIMLVNNETGAVMPVEAAAKAVKAKGAPALIHCDAVQGFGKMPINVNKLGVDLLTASGHKIHGPKGIGILYIKKGLAIKPLITGGGQEKGMRSGTESVPLICGLHGAVEELPELGAQLKKQRELWSYAADKISALPIAELNSDNNCLPYVLNISVPGYRSETLLHFLERQDVYVSSGSACAKGEGSYVLKEMGFSRSRVDSALRLSFSRFNTTDDIDRFITALEFAVSKLRKAHI